MSLFFRVSAIVAILGLFTGVGVLIGNRHVAAAQEPERFKMIDSTTAFDGKTGIKCTTEHIAELPGFTNDVPACAELAKR